MLVALQAALSLLPCEGACSIKPHKLWERHLRLAEMAITGSLHDEAGRCAKFIDGCKERLPYNATLRHMGKDWPPYGHTMVGHMRMQNIRSAIERVIHDSTPGDFVELGIWRGGACIYAAMTLDAYQQRSRHVYGFDAFGSMTYKSAEWSEFLAVSQEQVHHNFDKYGVPKDQYTLVPGRFEDTLPRWTGTGRPIAVLRIDGNFFQSHVVAFNTLYDRVPVGGIIILDDYEDPTVQRFWRHCVKRNPNLEGIMHEIGDQNGGWLQKKSGQRLVPL